MTEARRVLIVGCGYVGLELGRQLVAAGHVVFGLRRSIAGTAEVQAAGLTPIQGDLTVPQSLRDLPGPFDWVINTVSSSRGGPEAYRTVFREGTAALIAAFRKHPPAAFAYTSSTSVYGQTNGAWVDESAPTHPETETGHWLVETEQLLLQAAREEGFPVRIVRAAGIYGPGRGHLFQQFLRGEARLTGDGSRWLNMIHRNDVAGALSAVLAQGGSGEIYNAVDAEPVTQAAFLGWLAQELGRPLPRSAEGEESQTRKRGITHKRVSAEKLRQMTNWRPRFPTFREGYAAELAAVLNAEATHLPSPTGS